MKFTDTICSIITGIGPSAVSIIRLSGEDSIEIAGKLWGGKREFKSIESHRAVLGNIVDNYSGQLIDEGLFIIMKGPKSYTGEDVVEIQSHGSFIGINYILELLIKNGARHAEAGEFTKRAFLNGKLDLTKAEGIIDLIEAKNKQGLQFAAKTIGGTNFSEVNNIISNIVEILAYLEASIDFPEDDVPTLSTEEKFEKINRIKEDLQLLLLRSEKSKYINEGIRILILGEPNVGKSSFLNLLLNEERAIVSDIPGTTRDTIEEYLTIGKIPAKIIDTAGIRKSEDLIEKIGIEKAKDSIEKADLIIYMIDLSQEYFFDKDEIFDLIRNKNKIILLNKIDILNKDEEIDRIKKHFPGEIILPFSTKGKRYLDILEKEIENIFIDSSYDFNEGAFITNVRQKGLLEKAFIFINQALNSVINEMEDDFITIDLYDAKSTLEEIIGNNVNEDIMHEIFSKFCIGK